MFIDANLESVDYALNGVNAVEIILNYMQNLTKMKEFHTLKKSMRFSSI